MAKEQHAPKNEKKAPAKSMKEKKAAKNLKKETSSREKSTNG